MDISQALVDKLHQEAIIVDAHLDLPADLYAQHSKGKKNVIRDIYMDDFKKGGVNVIVAALFINSRDLPETAGKQALGQLGALYEELESAKEYISLCRSYSEIQDALESGKIALLLSFEGAEPLGDNPELLKVFYELGLRGLGLCWSRKNLAADGALFSEVEQGQKAGLSNLGYRLVREAERLGMFIDVSHINDEGFEDIKKITTKPFIASHSNCRSLNRMERNLSDEQIKDIGSRGGVIGINCSSAIIAPLNEKATVAALVAHIKHVISLAGIEHVGLGLDFSARTLPNGTMLDVGGKKIATYDVIKGYNGLKELTLALLAEGFTEEQIRLIYGDNFMRLFRDIIQ